ncbi:FmdB family zinc ribbon protein [Streptomyces yerevanensis]|uniref:FmdB family zinc ribbon protein n=1 Tax=Streptomyces yerevanensis TaxID=66378 RepID=UPI000525281A|nr:zinc ribbon domain-containing protein [Streptomyces yerevanensis]
MATYQYRCSGCGTFDVIRPMGSALPEEPCDACGGQARRVFTAPMLTRTPVPLSRALNAQEASAHAPRVVSEVPRARRSPAAPADPRHTQLPKP